MKILFVVSNSMIGGAETVLKRLLKNLDRRIYVADVLVTGEMGGLHEEYVRYANEVFHLPIGGANIRKWLVAAIRREKYEAVHFFNHWNLYKYIAKIKRVLPNVRIYASLMANFQYQNENWAPNIKEIRKVEHLFHGFTTDAWLNKLVFPGITVIRDGVSPEIFSPGVKRPKTIAWVGRASHGKKITKIMELAMRLRDYSFVLVASTENEITKQIRDVNIPNLRIMIGLNEREIADILAEAQYFVFTSHSEAMPLTLLEAMASECCCISEQVGDISAVIKNGVNGYLVPKGEDPSKWIAWNIRKFNVEVGKAARRRIIHFFTEDQMTKHFEFLYGQMGYHHGETRIAFAWAYPNFPAEKFWRGKIDSMQHAIAELSKRYVVQVFVPTEGRSIRRVINGQNIQFFKFKSAPELISLMRKFNPHMIFLNMFREKMWPAVTKAFPKAWKSVMHYGDISMRVLLPEEMDAVLVQQPYLKSLVAYTNKIPAKKIFVNPFCIETDRFRPLDIEKTYDAIMVADFRKGIKRQDLLIKAWRHVKGKLLLVGRFARSQPSGYHVELKALVAKLGIEDRVTLIDDWPHDRMPQLINQAKIGVMTSRQEGGSRALTEVMACGLPMLVLKDCLGTVTTVRNGIDGLIAAPKPRSIAAAINFLLEEYEEMGMAAARKVHNEFHYGRMLKLYLDFIKKARPEVSIITTSMNRGGYIEDCLKSVLMNKAALRDYGLKAKVNHIIMDGGSKDDTLKILEKYRHEIYVWYKRDRGQTDALIRAMKIIDQQFPETEYIGWVNADDYYLNNWLSDSLEQLSKAGSDIAMSCSDMQVVGLYPHSLHFTDRFITAKFLCERGNMVFQPTVLIRMSHFKRLKRKHGFYWDPEYDYCQDFELWARFTLEGYRLMRLNGRKGQRMNFVAALRTHRLQMSRTHQRPQRAERNKILRWLCAAIKQETPRWMEK